jgi:16S rRNA (guanine527-N7)-methyltransferase
MKLIRKYFPDLTELQYNTLETALHLYQEWNEKINVISRKDMEFLEEHHFIHSMAIAKHIQFKPEATILDVGTGGGFPGIPLAILFPETQFTLLDSIAKKIKVVEEIAKELQLTNVIPTVNRVENITRKFDFITARAVTALPEFCMKVTKNISSKSYNQIPNGILYLKGGNFDDELSRINLLYRITPLSNYFEEEFFETKKLIHLY